MLPERKQIQRLISSMAYGVFDHGVSFKLDNTLGLSCQHLWGLKKLLNTKIYEPHFLLQATRMHVI